MDSEKDLLALAQIFSNEADSLEKENNDLKLRLLAETAGTHDFQLPIALDRMRVAGVSLPSNVKESEIKTLAEMLLCLTPESLDCKKDG